MKRTTARIAYHDVKKSLGLSTLTDPEIDALAAASERWEQIQRTFDHALALAAHPTYSPAECAEDPDCQRARAAIRKMEVGK